MDSFSRPIFVAGNDPSRRFTVFGGENTLHAAGRETGGVIGMFEAVIAPGGAARPHMHTREDESFYVLAGTFRFRCGDEVFEAGPGSSVTLPRGVPHEWQNIGEADGRLLIITVPGGLEEMFLAIDRDGLTDPAALKALEERYGIVGSGF